MAETQEEPPQSSPSSAGPTSPLPPLSLLSISPASPASTEETPAPSPPPTSRTSLQHGTRETRREEYGNSGGGAGPSQLDVVGGPIRERGDAGFEFPGANPRRRNVRNLITPVVPLQSEPAESSLQPAAASSYPVFLHVYELRISRLQRFIGQKFFHSGVEVHNLEYQYYGHNRSTSGVIFGSPLRLHGSDLMRHQTSCCIGRTNEDSRSVSSSVALMGRGFSGFVFDLFKKNGNHFSDFLCRQLTGNPIPPWINEPLTFGPGLKLGKYLVPVNELHRLLIKNYVDLQLAIAHNHDPPPLQGSAGIASHGMVLSSDEDTAPYDNDNRLDEEEDSAFWAYVGDGGDPTGEDGDDGGGEEGEEEEEEGGGEEQP